MRTSTIVGSASESTPAGAYSPEFRRECTRVDAQGLCARWEWRRTFVGRRATSFSGPLEVERLP